MVTHIGYTSSMPAVPRKKTKQKRRNNKTKSFRTLPKILKMNLEFTINGVSTKKKAPSSISTLDRPKKLIAFGWYGGKYSHLDWLLPFLPKCTHYCEPFAGSGAVLLNREPSPVETYNDLDSAETLFYCDPPYIHETRGDISSYGYEMDNSSHEVLATKLNKIEGLVAISNYDCDLMNDLYPSTKWFKHYSELKTIHSTKDKRQEVLWLNYNINQIRKMQQKGKTLFE